MLRKFSLFFIALLLTTAFSTVEAANINLQTQPLVKQEIPKTENEIYLEKLHKKVDALALVANPQKYMDKKIRIKAKFDKFSAIGLDYEPAARPAKEYISFLIKREDVTNYNIPLSELKLIVKRDYAEKELVNLEAGDEIEIYGKVFCLALGDPWVDVDQVKILTIKENKEKNN